MTSAIFNFQKTLYFTVQGNSTESTKYQLDLGVIYFILKGSGDKGKSKHMRHQTHSKTMQQLSRHDQPID